jgi:hypothetical protein
MWDNIYKIESTIVFIWRKLPTENDPVVIYHWSMYGFKTTSYLEKKKKNLIEN